MATRHTLEKAVLPQQSPTEGVGGGGWRGKIQFTQQSCKIWDIHPKNKQCLMKKQTELTLDPVTDAPVISVRDGSRCVDSLFA